MSDKHNILITGGASGIGFAIAQAVQSRGWRPILADLSAENLKVAKSELPDALVLELDVTDEDGVAKAIAELEASYGPLEGVVNSAGIGHDVPCLETSAALYRQILNVNLIGSFLVARECAKKMKERGRGAIVNIASVSGMKGNVGRVAYGASKAGVINMTQVMAVELAGHGIRVNAISPGVIETPLIQRMHTAERRLDWIKEIPQHRYGHPHELGGAAVFLLDNQAASYVTGHVLCVDGGFQGAGLIGSY